MTSTTKVKTERVITDLAELPPETVIDEAALARIFQCCPKSIKRAVKRKELPRSVKLLGKPTWTARVVSDHLTARLEAAKREAERLERKISELGG